MKGSKAKLLLTFQAGWFAWALAASVTIVSTPSWAGLLDGWDSSLYLENDTHYRGEDAQDNRVGLSKVRNTLQADFRNSDLGGWEFKALLRGTYDGVYDLNEEEYGNHQGGPIELQSQPVTPDLVNGVLGALSPLGLNSVNALSASSVPHGGGFSVGFLGFNSTNPNAPRYNPNQGLRVLGDRWHSTRNGGVEFATPVRPCNIDKRGCVDFGGYGNQDQNELTFTEFNSRLDFLREINVARTFPVGDREIFVKVGRQQIIWGRTDLFRVLDVINPVDYSRNNIYDELQDIRYPMWIAQTEYRMGALGFLSDANVQLIWNVDRFRPNNLGQCGQPNVALNAGCLFRGLKNIWDNGGTVANFAHLTPESFVATDFGPHQLGIRSVDYPKWKLSNTQYGGKFEGVTDGGIGFSLNALEYRSQLPALHGGTSGMAVNSFTGVEGRYPYLIAFDLVYPRVRLFGGSLDFQVDAIKTAFRVEMALTQGEQFADTTKEKLYSEHNVFRSVIGADRLTFIPWISKSRTSLISAQLFFQHIFDHVERKAANGRVGMPDFENNAIATLVIKSFLMNDRLSPQLIQAYDVQAQAYVVSPQIDFLVTDKFRITLGANVKMLVGDARDNWTFDDARGTNPFPPFSGLNYDGNPLEPYSRGQQGIEPLGVFRSSIIGTAVNEDEIYVGFRYSLF